MPYGNAVNARDKLLRVLAYGDAKTKKTWWSCLPAKLGYNVILLEADEGGAQIIEQNFTPEERAKILICDLVTREDKTIFFPFVKQLLNPGKSFIWDEDAKDFVEGNQDTTHAHIRFEAAKFTPNDVLVIDGWKALVQSSLFEFADKQKLDLSDAKKTEWPGYSFQMNFLNWVLARLAALNCHIIVIGHAYTYEKWDRRAKDPREHKLLWSKTMVVSSSGTHSGTIPSQFSDVFFFDRLSETASTINTGGSRDRDGGSRSFPPEVHQWEKFGPDKLFTHYGSKQTGEPCLGAQWFPAGQIVSRWGNPAATSPSPVVQAPINAPAPGGGIRGLLKKTPTNSAV